MFAGKTAGKMKKILLLVFIFLILAIAGSSDAACQFRAAPTAMSFGNLSPANTTDAIATSTVQIRCTIGPNPYPYTMSDDSGIHELVAGSPRMQNQTVLTEFLPYEFTYTAAGSIPRNTWVVFTFTGTVRAINYQNAYVGAYTDTVTVTINP